MTLAEMEFWRLLGFALLILESQGLTGQAAALEQAAKQLIGESK